MRKICAHDKVKTATFREIVQDFAVQIHKIDDFLFLEVSRPGTCYSTVGTLNFGINLCL